MLGQNTKHAHLTAHYLNALPNTM